MEWKLGVVTVVTAGIFAIAFAQVSDNPHHLKPVILNVIATDRAGHPVTDLQPGDLRVADDGAQQQITSLRLNPSNPNPALVILLDLLDLSFQQAGYEAKQLQGFLAGLKTSDPLYLYVLVANGTLYPVHAVPATDAPHVAGNAEWIENAGPSLKQALEKVSQARSVEFISHPDKRFNATYSVLDSVRQELSRIHGRKQLLWITDGIPSSIRFSEGWVDLAPRLRQLGAQFNHDEIAIYTLDPSLALGTLNRDGLEVLSAATGGRAMITSDLKTTITRARMDASASYELEYGPVVDENAEGRFHSVRVVCNRKDVRIVSEGAYLAEVEPVREAAVETARDPALVMRAIPPEPVHTFVGLVRTVDSQSMVLELEDTRFIVVDFKGKQRIDPHPGDRISVRGGGYDGHGLVADSLSVMQAATPESTSPPTQSERSPVDADPFLKRAREAEAKMDRELPNFLCREVVQRYEFSEQKDWQLQDRLSAEVLYSRKEGETYRDIRVDGKPSQKPWIALGGDISTGEFGSFLHNLLANRDAQFELIKEDSVNGVAAREYSFRINRSQSDWKILSDYQYIVPQYRGRVWFDRDGNHVLRIERRAEGIPSAFPLSSMEAEVDFGEIRLGSSQIYSLPARAETRVCLRDQHKCSRKTIDFRDYKQFSGDSKITF